MDWNEVLLEYLAASAADRRESLDIRVDTKRARFIEAFGSVKLQQREANRIAANIAASQLQPAPIASYQVISESSSVVYVQVEDKQFTKKPRMEAYKLVLEGNAWKLDDHFFKCQCDNGKCGWCSGAGICAVCDGRGKCNFCRGKHFCQLCDGAKKCTLCNNSELAGWNSMWYRNA